MDIYSRNYPYNFYRRQRKGIRIAVKIFQIISEIFIAKSKNLWYKGEIMRNKLSKRKIIDTPLVLLILFFVFLYALVFSIRSVVTPLRQEIVELDNTETEIIIKGKIYEIIERY